MSRRPLPNRTHSNIILSKLTANKKQATQTRPQEKNASQAAKLHEMIHAQHILEAKKAGAQTKDITSCPPYQKALDEILASTKALAFLERIGGSRREIKEEQINIELSLEQLKTYGIIDLLKLFGVENIGAITQNLYS